MVKAYNNIIIMSIRLSIKDYIKTVIESLDIIVPVDVITDNGNGTYLIETCDTKHLRKYRPRHRV